MTSATKSNEKLVNQKLCNTVLILDALYATLKSFFHVFMVKKTFILKFSVQGQLISKCPSSVFFKSTKKRRKLCKDFFFF